MPLRFVHIEHAAHLCCHAGVEQKQPLGDVLVDCLLADLEYARCIPDGRAILNDICCRLKDALLDIIVQCIVPPSNLC